MLDQRGQLLRAALGFAGLPQPSYDLPLHALRSWLDSWSGIGRVVVGMALAGTAARRRLHRSCRAHILSSGAGTVGGAAAACATSTIASECIVTSSSASTNVRLLVGNQCAYHWSVVVGLLWPKPMVGTRYWEGAVAATGTSAGRTLGGRGYVELVGYGE